MKDHDALKDRKDKLSEAKRALLELRLRKKREATPRIPPIVPCSRTEPIPLSFAQQRLWFLHQWDPTSSQYAVPVVFRLRGLLDVEALSKAIDALVARHESLRTTFSLDAETPYQHIHSVQSSYLSILKISQGAEGEQESEIFGLIAREKQKPFDLSQGPLFRATLLDVTKQDHVLILCLHHIITDGWSMGILYKELAFFYNTLVSGTPSSLPAPQFQYADFAVWQRHWLQGDLLNSQVAYWKHQLVDVPAYLELPTDFPRPAIQSHRGSSQNFTFNASLTQSLQALRQRQGCTLFMTLLAAYHVLLSRYTGQDDIVVGSPIANRTQQELEDVVGFFVNTLALRARLGNHLTFRQVLANVQKVCLDAYTHQDLPFEKLVEELHPTRDSSRSPIIQTLFQVHSGGQPPATLTGLEMEQISTKTVTSKMDLTVSLVERSDGLTGRIEYDTALFRASTIHRFIAHFQNLLEGIVANPDQWISKLPLLSPAERAQLLEPQTANTQPYPHDQCVHQLFEFQARRTPDAIAVVFEDTQITYEHLDQCATLLGRFLQQLGVGLEIRVGLYLDHSIDMVVALLGILKAGGVYVPLDPTYPRERLAYMIHDAEIEVILTQTQLQDSLDSLTRSPTDSISPPCRVILLDTDWHVHVHVESLIDQSLVKPDNLAYVIYTSGSTGQPKGAEIVHRAIARLVKGTDFIPFSPKEIFLQLAPLSFDAATFEIWGSLLHGARLVLWPNHSVSVDTIKHVLQLYQVSTLWLTAALFHQMVDQDLKGFDTVRYLLTGGDVVSPARVRKTFQLLDNVNIINGYGPTENTTFTCCYPMTSLSQVPQGSISIGRPIANTTVALLDQNQQLVPVGIPGELYMGGAGLARGYQRRPSLTAERFIPNAFGHEPGSRLYRSGDLVRYREDGSIEFLGRKDHQVKIRGFRIELGEVETALNQHPAVHETLALTNERESGEKQLVAYIVSRRETTPSISDLRHFLADKLPAYMIPTAFISLEAFPVTPNGKIDRAKLPSVEQTPLDHRSYQAPRNSVESQMVAIWETILERQPIGVTDNFFDMGGESLLAVRLSAKLDKVFPGKISIPMIFQSQTIEELSKIIQGEKEQAPWNWLVPIQTHGPNPPVFCVLFGSTFRPYVKQFHSQPLYLVITQSHDGKPALYSTVEEIATQYIKEIRTVQAEGPYCLAGYSFGGLLAYEMAQQLSQQGESIAFLGLVDPTCPHASPSPVLTATERLQSALRHTPSKSKGNPGSLYGTLRMLLSRIVKGIGWRLQAWTSRSFWMNPYHKLVCRVYVILGRPLPRSVRKGYRTRNNTKAAQKYVPQPYSGKITIFQSSPDPEAYYGKLCKNDIEAFRLPGSHISIVQEPNVSALVSKFIERLEASRNHD